MLAGLAAPSTAWMTIRWASGACPSASPCWREDLKAHEKQFPISSTMSYKVIYHIGNDLNLKTKVNSGTLTFDSEHVHISGSNPLVIAYLSFRNVEMLRLHGLGRIIKLTCSDITVFTSVVRLNLFGYFVIINYFKSGTLCEQLKTRLVLNGKSSYPS